MSMCAGKTECKIYRDKAFCAMRKERENGRGVCTCRHARLQCEVRGCVLEGSCEIAWLRKENKRT